MSISVVEGVVRGFDEEKMRTENEKPKPGMPHRIYAFASESGMSCPCPIYHSSSEWLGAARPVTVAPSACP